MKTGLGGCGGLGCVGSRALGWGTAGPGARVGGWPRWGGGSGSDGGRGRLWLAVGALPAWMARSLVCSARVWLERGRRWLAPGALPAWVARGRGACASRRGNIEGTGVAAPAGTTSCTGVRRGELVTARRALGICCKGVHGGVANSFAISCALVLIPWAAVLSLI